MRFAAAALPAGPLVLAGFQPACLSGVLSSTFYLFLFATLG
jgi:hypothetical protein